MSELLEKMIDDCLSATNPEAKVVWRQVIDNRGKFVVKDEDAANRPKFVGGIQACFESSVNQLLKDNLLEAAVCVIHTKLPPTPLRTDGIVLAEGLISPEVAADPLRLETVTKRPNILRTFLENGGRLLAAYPESSLEGELPGIGIYQSLLEKYPDNLIDYPIAIEELSNEYSGATCLIQDEDGVTLFSIAATQASSPGNQMGVWFGHLELEAVEERYVFVDSFLGAQGLSLKDELCSLAAMGETCDDEAEL